MMVLGDIFMKLRMDNLGIRIPKISPEAQDQVNEWVEIRARFEL